MLPWLYLPTSFDAYLNAFLLGMCLQVESRALRVGILSALVHCVYPLVTRFVESGRTRLHLCTILQVKKWGTHRVRASPRVSQPAVVELGLESRQCGSGVLFSPTVPDCLSLSPVCTLSRKIVNTGGKGDFGPVPSLVWALVFSSVK